MVGEERTVAQVGLSARRHRTRQMRARIVELAREYKEACDAYVALYSYMWRADVQMTNMLYEEEQRTWEAMEQRRDALFSAVGLLEMLEEQRQ